MLWVRGHSWEKQGGKIRDKHVICSGCNINECCIIEKEKGSQPQISVLFLTEPCLYSGEQLNPIFYLSVGIMSDAFSKCLRQISSLHCAFILLVCLASQRGVYRQRHWAFCSQPKSHAAEMQVVSPIRTSLPCGDCLRTEDLILDMYAGNQREAGCSVES